MNELHIDVKNSTCPRVRKLLKDVPHIDLDRVESGEKYWTGVVFCHEDLTHVSIIAQLANMATRAVDGDKTPVQITIWKIYEDGSNDSIKVRDDCNDIGFRSMAQQYMDAYETCEDGLVLLNEMGGYRTCYSANSTNIAVVYAFDIDESMVVEYADGSWEEFDHESDEMHDLYAQCLEETTVTATPWMDQVWSQENGAISDRQVFNVSKLIPPKRPKRAGLPAVLIAEERFLLHNTPEDVTKCCIRIWMREKDGLYECIGCLRG